MITLPQLGENGRLGNQVLQFFAAYALARRTGQHLAIPHIPGFTENLSLPGWVHVMPRTDLPKFDRWHVEKRFAYDQPMSGMYQFAMTGFYQSYKYFADCDDELYEVCNPLRWAVTRQDAIALCVRRTDYVHSNDFHAVLDTSYYSDALRLMPSLPVVVFSDDIPWCREHIIHPNASFFDKYHDQPWLKLWEIAACRHQIIANSTFHMLGAWLNRDSNKNVVWPKRWFGSSGPNDQTDDICPKEWVRI